MIYRCVESKAISQRFFDNLTCVRLDPSGLPVQPFQVIAGRYPNSCPPACTKFYPAIGMKAHGGIDRPIWDGAPVYFDAEMLDPASLSSQDMTGTLVGWKMLSEIDADKGIGVWAISDRPVLKCREQGCSEVHYIKRLYHHVKKVIGFDGKVLKFGDLIALGDSTGASSGPHVHDSTKWSDAEGNTLHTDNGYYGGFDDSDLRTEDFVVDVVNLRITQAIAVANAQKSAAEAEELRKQLVVAQVGVLDLLKKWLFQISEALKSRQKVES